MTASAIIGWIGVALGVCVSVPQLCQILRTRRAGDVSVWTYRLLLAVCLCYLVRAVAIGELIFVVSNAVNIGISAWVLWLKWRYHEEVRDAWPPASRGDPAIPS